MPKPKSNIELHAAVLPLKPSLKDLKRLRFILKLIRWPMRLFFKKYIRNIEIIGAEYLQGGPKLVLMNHTNALDPMILTFFGNQVIHFLVTESFMAERKSSRLAAWLGQIPKRKLDIDTRSIRTMKQWCEVGGTVGMFPEGQFSWDGSPSPVQPGLAELIRYLEVPVVTARLTNGDRLWPAWAKRSRRTSLRLEIDPPRRFSKAEKIEEYIAEKIHVDPAHTQNTQCWSATGRNLAEGMANFFRFCFYCKADGALSDHENNLTCEHCKTAWEVSADHQLYSHSAVDVSVPSISVANAWKKIQTNLSQIWNENIELRSQGEVTVMDASRSKWVTLENHSLELKHSKLKADSWQLPLSEITAYTMDWGDLILIRTLKKRFAIRLSQDSRAVWMFALDRALEMQNINFKKAKSAESYEN